MIRAALARWFCLGAAGALSAGCTADPPTAAADMRMPPVDAPCTLDPSAPLAEQIEVLAACAPDALSKARMDSRLRRDLDVLFVIHNSPSIIEKQAALVRHASEFIRRIDESGADYHIGIVTTDVGSTTAPGLSWGGSSGSCDTYAGDDGRLQSQACTARTQGTAEARTACTQLCPDDRFVPTDGRRFIAKIDGLTNVPVAMELDPRTGRMADTGPQKAFGCMALVGDSGCGIEAPLESARRALDGHLADNSGFLRAGSTLAVVFLTDEDDCSVQLSRRWENSPLTRACDPAQPDRHDCYNIDYRCLARSLTCDESMLTPGVKHSCRERQDSYLESVDRYTRFFMALRPADKLQVSGIWTRPSIQSGGRVEIVGRGDTTSPFLNRAGGAGAACAYAPNPGVYGEPQLRLSKFAGALFGTETSSCDLESYRDALSAIGSRVVAKLTATCLAKPPRRAAGQPSCLVREQDEAAPTATGQALPACSSGCCDAWASASPPTATDPAIQDACRGERADACFCALPSRADGVCSGGAVAGVWRRGGAPPPAGKAAVFTCVNQ